MACSRESLWNAPARLVNRRWGFAAEWVTLRLALEQFAAHPRDLQDGLLLEWSRRPGNRSTLVAQRLIPAQIRDLAGKMPAMPTDGFAVPERGEAALF